jgi:hypothetical protein
MEHTHTHTGDDSIVIRNLFFFSFFQNGLEDTKKEKSFTLQKKPRATRPSVSKEKIVTHDL